jgi:hypothetical protein
VSFTPVTTGARAPRRYRRPAGDKTRRNRWLEAVSQSPVSRGCKAWAMLLAERSNAMAKPVWGRQTGQAVRISCCDRTVRRYRQELEGVGLVETQRGEVHRTRDGQFYHQETNRYVFVVPPRPTRKKSSSYRADAGVRLNPLSTRDIETLRTRAPEPVDDDPPPSPFGFDRSHFADARRRLRPE